MWGERRDEKNLVKRGGNWSRKKYGSWFGSDGDVADNDDTQAKLEANKHYSFQCRVVVVVLFTLKDKIWDR